MGTKRVWGSPNNGRIIFGVWDGGDTTYTCVYEGWYDPVAMTQHEGLKSRGWPGVAGIACQDTQTNASHKITEAQCRDLACLGGAGWDVVTHAQSSGLNYGVPGTWTGVSLRANFNWARTYMDSIGVQGANILAPSGGLYDESWLAALEYFDYIIWGNPTDSYNLWPRKDYYDVQWRGCADIHDWATEVQPVLDLVINNPRKVVVCSLHRIILTTDTTTVDQDSNVGQKVLYVADTAPFEHGDHVKVNSGGVREEICHVNIVTDGVSLTMVDDLAFTHTALQADVVEMNVQGTQVSLTRLDQLLLYVDTLDATISSVSQLCLLCGNRPRAGGIP